MPSYYVAVDLLERPSTGLMYERGEVQTDTAWTSEFGSGGFSRLQANGSVLVDSHTSAPSLAATKAWRDAARAKVVKGNS